MARRFNGGLIGLVNAAKFGGDTTGLWTHNEIRENRIAGLWPRDDLTGTLIFNSSSSWVAPTGVNAVDYLVVAGGGGGGRGPGGGGGGAGGYQSGTQLSVTPGISYTIVVGSGGAGGSGAPYVG